MDAALYRLLNQEHTKAVMLRGQTLELRLLSAQTLLELRISQQAADDFSRALQTGAALIAKSLHAEGVPVFESEKEVLDTLCAEEINAVVAAYHSWSREIDPGFDCGTESIEALKKV